MNKCIRCGTIKEDSEFALRKFKSGNYGLRGACRDCMNKSNRSCRSNADRRAKYYETQKLWNARNRNRVLELKKIERSRNISRIIDYRRKYAESLPDALVASLIRGGKHSCVKNINIPTSLIQAKRLQILIKRQLREIKKCKQ